MAVLDVDTDGLEAAAQLLAATAGPLLTTHDALPDPPRTTGDATLASAVSALDDAWRPLRAALAAELGALARALEDAATLLEGGEASALARLAGAVADVPPRSTGPLLASAT